MYRVVSNTGWTAWADTKEQAVELAERHKAEWNAINPSNTVSVGVWFNPTGSLIKVIGRTLA